MKTSWIKKGFLTSSLIVLSLLLMVTLAPAQNKHAEADFVLLNGKIVTVDENNSIAQAVAVKSGKVIAIGDRGTVQPLIGLHTEVLDAGGRTVVPGMMDAHGHHVSTITGWVRPGSVILDNEHGVFSIADLLKAIADEIATLPVGARISGSLEDDFKMVEHRHPTKYDLDPISPNNPVSISTVGGHLTIYNSAALAICHVTKDTPDPVGGVWVRDPVTGEPNGIALEKASCGGLPALLPVTHEQSRKAVEWLWLDMSRLGNTLACEDPTSGTSLSYARETRSLGKQIVRYRGSLSLGSAGITAEQAYGDNADFRKVVGDDMIAVSGLKHIMDGAISARTAYMREPYLTTPIGIEPPFYGVLSLTPEQAQKNIDDAFKAGLRTLTHVNGDATYDIYLPIMEEEMAKYPQTDWRNIIIHATVVDPGIIAKIKQLDLVPSIFGNYVYYHGDKILPAFGPDRLERMFAARWMIDAGIKPSAHSDFSASPYNPLLGIHALVNRVSMHGQPVGQSQKISVMEALRLYTINGAYKNFEEDILGSLEVGKFGDMVVLGQDLLTVPHMSIKDIPVDMTILAGKVVFERGVTVVPTLKEYVFGQ